VPALFEEERRQLFDNLSHERESSSLLKGWKPRAEAEMEALTNSAQIALKHARAKLHASIFLTRSRAGE